MKSVLVAFTLLTLTMATVSFAASLVGEEDANWSTWKSLYKKSYIDEYEESFRRAIWMYNLMKVKEHNMAGNSFTMALNKFSDLTPIEYRHVMLNKRQHFRSQKERNRLDRVLAHAAVPGQLPDSVDWRKKGCVTAVGNQGELEGSWAFSAVGSLEGRHCVVTKQLLALNVTKLAQCCTRCHSVAHAFQYMITHNHHADTKISLGESALDQVENENCNFSKAAYGASLTGVVELPSGSELDLQRAVALIGPVSVTIDASHASFQLYHSGVYDEPSCSSASLDHAVLVVGYGTLEGTDYWLVKNSWGANWGMNGYILMSRNKDNQCGIASAAIYPTGVTLENHSRPSQVPVV